MKKWTVVVLFGGPWQGHTASCLWAADVIAALDREKYDVLPVGITKKGNWRICHGTVDAIREGRWEKYSVEAILSPDASRKSLLKLVEGRYKEIPVDVAIPLLWQGGAVEGLLEMAQVPYVGGSVLASALCSDRVLMKAAARAAKVPAAKFFWCDRRFLAKRKKKILGLAEEKLGFPCFVKTSNTAALSGGIKAQNREELEKALFYAAKYDRKVMVEEAIDGEVFSYDLWAEGAIGAGKGKAGMAPPQEALAQMRKFSEKICHAVDAGGVARVDFFMEKSGRVLFHQLHTMAGSSAISVSAAWDREAAVSKTERMDRLIAAALAAYGSSVDKEEGQNIYG